MLRTISVSIAYDSTNEIIFCILFDFNVTRCLSREEEEPWESEAAAAALPFSFPSFFIDEDVKSQSPFMLFSVCRLSRFD